MGCCLHRFAHRKRAPLSLKRGVYILKRLSWGLIGGGQGSQIGFAHRSGAEIDGRFKLMAGAMDVDPNVAKSYGASLGLDPSRAYGTWQEMLQGEKSRDDRIDLVTVATPNATHFEISKAFLEAGFHVLCEKPMTMTVPEAQALVQIAKRPTAFAR